MAWTYANAYLVSLYISAARSNAEFHMASAHPAVEEKAKPDISTKEVWDMAATQQLRDVRDFIGVHSGFQARGG